MMAPKRQLGYAQRWLVRQVRRGSLSTGRQTRLAPLVNCSWMYWHRNSSPLVRRAPMTLCRFRRPQSVLSVVHSPTLGSCHCVKCRVFVRIRIKLVRCKAFKEALGDEGGTRMTQSNLSSWVLVRGTCSARPFAFW
jgi:hypothetical protein